MNAPMQPGILGLLGVSLGNLTNDLLRPLERVTRRIILFQGKDPSKDHQGPYAQLALYRRRFGIGTGLGLTFFVVDPHFKGYPILAWSAIHSEPFVWADKAYVFDSSQRLHDRQRECPGEFERHERRYYLACDSEEGSKPTHEVKWKTLLLLKSVRPRSNGS